MSELKQTEDRNVVDQVESKINKLQEFGQLDLPKDYSAANALRGAWLVLQETLDKDKKPVLQTCSKESISMALYSMVIQGLSVVKKQGAFIAYGGKLQFQREYAGTMALAKRYSDVVDVTANTIYKGDDFAYEIMPDGKKRITKHVQKIENIKPENIIGAYATAIRHSGNDVEIMTYDQIKAAWSMNKAGLTPAHAKFPDQMCEKTVINRLLKPLINSSDDESLFEPGETRSEPKQAIEAKTIKPPENDPPVVEAPSDIEEAEIVESGPQPEQEAPKKQGKIPF